MGWFRLSVPHAQTLLKASGNKAIFCSIQEEVTKPNAQIPRWIPKLPDEPLEAYWDRVTELSKQRKQGMFFRKGYGSDLGFAQTAEDPLEHKMMVVEIQGLPNAWQAEERIEFLQKSKMERHYHFDQKKERKGAIWIVRGMPSIQEQGRKSWVFELERPNSETPCFVYINEAPPRPKKPSDRTWQAMFRRPRKPGVPMSRTKNRS